MSNTWIKMCGLKQRAEIEIAVELGVDAVGLVFYAPSVRSIGISEINELLTCELKGTKVVALFVNPSREEVEAVLSSGRIDLLQFHGCEEPEFCESFEVPYLKALGVEASVDTEEFEPSLHRYQSTQHFQLDAFVALVVQPCALCVAMPRLTANQLPRPPCLERLSYQLRHDSRV